MKGCMGTTMTKVKPSKVHYLAATNGREIMAIRDTYGEAMKSAKLLSGGHVLEIPAKSTAFALRFASRDHGYRPNPYLVQELGIKWDYE